MRVIEFLDTTLRDGEQTPGVNFSIKEKVTIAKQLEKWGISAIEAGFPAASPDSFEAVRQIAAAMTKTAVTGLARSVKSDIDACYEALKDAKYPQIHVFIATSPIHREFKLQKSKEEILTHSKPNVVFQPDRQRGTHMLEEKNVGLEEKIENLQSLLENKHSDNLDIFTMQFFNCMVWR